MLKILVIANIAFVTSTCTGPNPGCYQTTEYHSAEGETITNLVLNVNVAGKLVPMYHTNTDTNTDELLTWSSDPDNTTNVVVCANAEDLDRTLKMFTYGEVGSTYNVIEMRKFARCEDTLSGMKPVCLATSTDIYTRKIIPNSVCDDTTCSVDQPDGIDTNNCCEQRQLCTDKASICNHTDYTSVVYDKRCDSEDCTVDDREECCEPKAKCSTSDLCPTATPTPILPFTGLLKAGDINCNGALCDSSDTQCCEVYVCSCTNGNVIPTCNGHGEQCTDCDTGFFHMDATNNQKICSNTIGKEGQTDKFSTNVTEAELKMLQKFLFVDEGVKPDFTEAGDEVTLLTIDKLLKPLAITRLVGGKADKVTLLNVDLTNTDPITIVIDDGVPAKLEIKKLSEGETIGFQLGPSTTLACSVDESVEPNIAHCSLSSGSSVRRLDTSCFDTPPTPQQMDVTTQIDIGGTLINHQCSVQMKNDQLVTAPCGEQYATDNTTVYDHNEESHVYTQDTSCGICPPGVGVHGVDGKSCNTCGPTQFSGFDFSACTDCPDNTLQGYGGRFCKCKTGFGGKGTDETDGDGCTECQIGEKDVRQANEHSLCVSCAEEAGFNTEKRQIECRSCSGHRNEWQTAGCCDGNMKQICVDLDNQCGNDKQCTTAVN